jgi:sporulation protein YlmC with PRC-barrel domain
MTRTLMVFAAVSGLTMSTALAQTPAPPTPASPPGAAMSRPATGTGNSQVINTQASDEWLASKLKGTTVLGSDGQKIGDVADILVDRSGQVRAFIVGVGGVLGLGAKDVAIEMTEFQQIPAANGTVQLKVDMTKEQIAQAAQFKPLAAPATTTGAAPNGSRPAGAPPMAPRQ